MNADIQQFNSLIAHVEYNLERAKIRVERHIEQLQFDLSRNDLNILHGQGTRLDESITKIQSLRQQLDDLTDKRDAALATLQAIASQCTCDACTADRQSLQK